MVRKKVGDAGLENEEILFPGSSSGYGYTVLASEVIGHGFIKLVYRVLYQDRSEGTST